MDLHHLAYGVYARAVRLGRRIAYRGETFTCPFCAGSFDRMIPGGSTQPVWMAKDINPGGWRRHLYCPSCYATDKERFAYFVFESRGLLAAPRDTRLLHIAPEPHLARLLQRQPHLQYLSGDLTPGRAMQTVDLTRAPFDDARFDVVICSQVLEHIPDDAQAMRELFRLLSPGGWAYVPVPISRVLRTTFEDPRVTHPAERTLVFGQEDHVRIYAFDYVDRLRAVGFEVEVVLPRQLRADWLRYALNPHDIGIVAVKPAML